MSRRLAPIGLAAAALLTLAACTTGTDGERSSGPGKTADPDPAPEVSVAPLDASAADGGTGKPDSSAGDESTGEAEADADPSAAPSGDASAAAGGGATDLELKPGGHFSLTVTGGQFTQVTVTEDDHPEVTVAGRFDEADAVGAASDEPRTPGASPAEGSGATDEGSAEGSGEDGQAGGTTHSETAAAAAPSASDAQATHTSGADSDSTGSPSDAGQPEATADASEPQGTYWESSVGLAGDATYTWKAQTVAPDGGTHEATGTITTSAPEGRSARIFTVIGDEQEVGVAAPIVVNFGATIPESYRDEVESRLSVAVTDEAGKAREVEGSWGWLHDTDGISRVHYRPKEFWPEHSKVEVKMPMENVPFSKTRYGEKDVTLDFTIGREQTTKADAKTHRMVITRGDETVMDFPASLGAARSPSYNGIHVVMSKAANYTMTSERWGYSTPVRWAVRIHNNGEFIHGAPWSAGSQGSANVSHGCINLTNERAKEYYDSAIYGDPVIVEGSSVSLSTEDSDISDWVYEWDDWKKLSALD